MNYIEAIEDYKKKYVNLNKTIFLAGGITDCPDWQSDMVRLLKNTCLQIMNPRRKNFPIHDPNAAYKQILWEHKALRDAKIISFWFPSETLCPIALYELGAWSMTKKSIFIGVHPEYKRKTDIEIQTKLIRPDIQIMYSLNDLADHIMNSRIVAKWQKKYDRQAESASDGAF